jgi:hypothetical protein
VTAPNERADVSNILADHLRRIRILEALSVTTASSGLLTRITLEGFSLPDNTSTDLTYTAFDVNSCGVTTADFITFVVPALGANAVYGIHWYARMPDPFPVMPASWDFNVEGPWGTDVTINGITSTDRLVRGSTLNDSTWGVEANGIQQAPFTFSTRAYQDSGAALFMNGCMDIIYLGQWA